MPITAISLRTGCLRGVVFAVTITAVAGGVSVSMIMPAGGCALATTTVSWQCAGCNPTRQTAAGRKTQQRRRFAAKQRSDRHRPNTDSRLRRLLANVYPVSFPRQESSNSPVSKSPVMIGPICQYRFTHPKKRFLRSYPEHSATRYGTNSPPALLPSSRKSHKIVPPCL